MQLHSPKQDALEAIQQLPDTVDFEEIVYRLYVLSKINQGMKEVDEGRGISQEELAREIEQW
jgi:predicted transcriptional regulator